MTTLTMRVCAFLMLLSGAAVLSHAQTVTFAGAQTTVASGLNGPYGVAVDRAGDVFIAEPGNNRVVEYLSNNGTYGASTTVPASGLSGPLGVAVDGVGNVFIADTNNNRVVEVPYLGNGTYGTQTTVPASGLSSPYGVTTGAYFFIADTNNNRAVELDYLGNGTYGTQTTVPASGLSSPHGVAWYEPSVGIVDVFIADTNHNQVVEVPYFGNGKFGAQTIVPASGLNNPYDLAVDGLGDLYIADTLNNRVVEVPANGGTQTTLWSSGLNQPHGVALDGSGDVFIADTLNNQVVEVQRWAVNFGGVNVCPGQTAPAPCSQMVTLNYQVAANTTFGATKVVTQGAPNLDFTLSNSTCTGMVTASDTCTVNVTFAPLAPGARMGVVQLFDNSGNLLVTTPVHGIGQGPAIAFGPGAQTAIASALNFPEGVAVDGAGDVFFADFNNNQVVKITPGGVQTTVGSGLVNPEGLAVDGAGDLFITDSTGLVEVTPSGSQTTVVASGQIYPIGVAVDGAGDLFIADSVNSQVWKVTPGGTTALLSGQIQPIGVTVDGAGDVFIVDVLNNRVVEVTPSGVQTTVASGLSQPRFVAVDGAGNVFIADYGNNRVVEVPAGGGAQTTVGSGLNTPVGVALDGKGNVFIADSGSKRVVEVMRSQPPSLSFAATAAGGTSSDSPQSLTVQNIGNQSLNAVSPGLAVTGPNFVQVAGLGTPTDCTSTFELAPGASCNLSISFNPQTSGPLASSAAFTDNALNGSPSASQTIALAGAGTIVNLAAQTITFAPIGTQTVGVPFPLVATASSGLPVSFAGGCGSMSGDQAIANFSGICTIVASQGGNANYSAAPPVSQSFTVNGQSQTIIFSAIATQTVGTPLTLTATASSGLPVTYTSSTTGICTVSPTTATFQTGGTCTIVASQSGNASFNSYAPATSVTQSFLVNQNPQPQTITFGAIAAQTAGIPLALTATASSGLPVSFASSTPGICTVSGNQAALIAGGTCTIVASQAGSGSYAAATPMTQSFTVNLQPQTITFGAIATQGVGMALTLTATASSGLPVMYTSSTTGVCTVSATGATFLTGGTCTIVASQAGNASYAAATSVTQSFPVNLSPQPQSITFGAIPSQAVGTPLTLTATASSGLPVTYTSSTTVICTVSATTATFLSGGTCTIVASQAGNAAYAAATSVMQSFVVNQYLQPQTITFVPIGTQTVGVAFALVATASSGLPVVFKVTAGNCIFNSNIAIANSSGTCTIVASQGGNGVYAAAPSVSQSFVVNGNQQPQSITFTTAPPANAAYNTSFTVAASAGSGLPVAFTSSGSCTNVGASYTMTSGAGMCSAIANQAGNANYSAATTTTRTVTATPASQTITFPTVPTQSGPGTVTLAATASAGMQVSYTVNSGPATVSGNLLTTTGAGSVKVTASQAGGTNYSAAAPVSQSFTVNANAVTLNGRNCNGAYTGTFNGSLTVSAGQTCAFTNGGVTGNLTLTGGTLVLNNNSSINGNLQMSGGSLSISNVTVGGNLQIDGGGTFSIGSGVTIANNLQLSNLPPSAGTDQVCGAKIQGDLQLQNSATAVLIGAASGCAGNKVSGNLQLQNNTASTRIDSNTVGGNLTDQNNTAATQVFTNVITGQLQCSGNSSITGGGNTASSKKGQCAAF